MPDPDYNLGDAPPIWVWIVGLSLVVFLLALIQSCTG